MHPAQTSGSIMNPSNAHNLTVCSRCVYDETFPGIEFNDEGQCNYCELHDQLEEQYPNDLRGAAILNDLVEKIRSAGKRKKYDCVVGVSGGCDSSFLLYQAIKLGLRPLAVHFDNTWNSPQASQNLYNVTTRLGVDLYTHVGKSVV